MPLSPTQLRRAQLRDALIYWLYIPAAVLLGGKAADLLFRLPPLPSFARLPALPATLLIGSGTLLIQKATLDLRRYGNGTPNPQAPPARLVTEGAFAFCRHPMFLGYDLAALGTVLLLHSWGMLALAWPVFIALQIRFLKKREEPLLARRFGGPYAAYRARVPFLLPYPLARRRPS